MEKIGHQYLIGKFYDIAVKNNNFIIEASLKKGKLLWILIH